MATHAISWAPGAHVCFGDLDLIVTIGGELALTHTAAQPLPSINLSRLRLEGPQGDSLGPQLSREPPHNITLFPEGPVRSAPIAFPFGLRNATATAGHLLALRMVQPPTDSEFVGVIEHDLEILYELLAEEPESSSGSESSKGSHHPSLGMLHDANPRGARPKRLRRGDNPNRQPRRQDRGGGSGGSISRKDGAAKSTKAGDR